MGVIDEPDRWIVKWTGGAMSGRHVTFVNPTTGQQATGHDWSDWDPAVQKALNAIESQGDLISEIETFLDSA